MLMPVTLTVGADMVADAMEVIGDNVRKEVSYVA